MVSQDPTAGLVTLEYKKEDNEGSRCLNWTRPPLLREARLRPGGDAITTKQPVKNEPFVLIQEAHYARPPDFVGSEGNTFLSLIKEQNHRFLLSYESR